MKREIILIVHNLRSTHNVGSLLRTAEGLGVSVVYLTGYTPYPEQKHDKRLPHISQKLTRQIHKTALEAEKLIKWEHREDIKALLSKLKKEGYSICALEQSPQATALAKFRPAAKIAIVVGREVEGIEHEVLAEVDQLVEIPMLGKKESFNVVQAASMALYHCRYL